MAYFDKKNDFVFPTRTGEVQGAATERQMLDSTSPDRISTRMRDNPDGGVTMLRTRGGFPEFTTEKVIQESQTVALRGFVRRAAYGVAELFHAVTLAVRKIKYAIYGATYTVCPGRSRVNEKANVGWLWNDVVAFMGTRLYVNGDSKRGGLPPATVPTDAIYTPVALANATASPTSPFSGGALFAVGRAAVELLAPAVHSSALTPTSPQPFGDPYRSGPKISYSGAGATVYLSQLWWTGSDGWDDNAGTWAGSWLRSSLERVSPYVTDTHGAISVECPNLTPTDDGASVGTTQVDFLAPAAQCGYLGVFSVAGITYDRGYISFMQLSPGIVGTYSVPTHARRITDWSRRRFSGSFSTTVTTGDCTAEVFSTTALYRVANVEQVTTVGTVEPTGAVNTGKNVYGWSVTTTGVLDAMTLVPVDSTHDTPYGTVSIPAGGSGTSTSASYENQHQDTQSSITVDGIVVSAVSMSFDIVPAGGDQINIVPKTLDLPGDPNTYSEFNLIQLSKAFRDFPSDGSYTYNNDRHAALCASAITDLVSNLAGVTFYYPGSFGNGTVGSDRHTYTKTSRPAEFSSSLNWSTRDYVLYDADEGCYVYVEGVFSGSQSYTGPTASDAVATLNVRLHIVTRTGSATQSLYSTTFAFPELFIIEEIVPNVLYTRVPKQRVLFFPLYKNQGSFRGAAYTTALEEAGGAAPACVMNFRLSLVDYNGLDGLTPDINNAVAFVPMNLVEMLYAFVYSNSAGQDDFERYPVFYPAYKTRLDNTLFATTWNVGFNNGILGSWAASPTMELGRT